ncbi:MAG TPA: serine/threonine protein kinase, partial [Phormidium sp.]
RMGLWGIVLGGLIFAQNRQIIQRSNLLIIAGVTLALVWFISRSQPIEFIVGVPIIAGVAAIAITALFRLIHKLLSTLF